MKPRIVSLATIVLLIGLTRESLAAGEVENYAKARAVVGDFDGDGIRDFANGVPTRSSNRGAVEVRYDFDASNVVDETWTRETSGILGTAEMHDHFGSDLAAGDFDGDGYDDLAIGVPGDDDVVGGTDVGSIQVIYGSLAGLTNSRNEVWQQGTSGVPGVADASDHFGEFLAAGDFNCDGYDDLAIGAPQDDIGTLSDAGTVTILFGGRGGLAAAVALWDQDSVGIDGIAEADDHFGGSLGVGNFDGDSSMRYECDDLVVGVPGDTVSGQHSAGSVHAIYGSNSGLTSTGSQYWHQDSLGIVDVANEDDQFGTYVGAHDDDADGYADVVLGVPGEDSCSSGEGFHVAYGSSGGLSPVDDELSCLSDGVLSSACNWSGSTILECNCSCNFVVSAACVSGSILAVEFGEECYFDWPDIVCTAPDGMCE